MSRVLARRPGKGCYVNPRYGLGTSFTEVQGHPLHILASRDLTSLDVDPSKHAAVVDDVPYVISDFFEANVLALERIAQEVLAGESEGSAGAHSPDLEVAGIFGLWEAAWVLLPGRLPPLGWEVTMECFVRSLVVVALLEDIQLLLLLQSPVWIPERSTSKTPRNRGVFSGPSPARRKVSAAAD